MQINVKSTDWKQISERQMVVSREESQLATNIKIKNLTEQVESFSYLRRVITGDGKYKMEIKRWIGMVKKKKPSMGRWHEMMMIVAWKRQIFPRILANSWKQSGSVLQVDRKNEESEQTRMTEDKMNTYKWTTTIHFGESLFQGSHTLFFSIF